MPCLLVGTDLPLGGVRGTNSPALQTWAALRCPLPRPALQRWLQPSWPAAARPRGWTLPPRWDCPDLLLRCLPAFGMRKCTPCRWGGEMFCCSLLQALVCSLAASADGDRSPVCRSSASWSSWLPPLWQRSQAKQRRPPQLQVSTLGLRVCVDLQRCSPARDSGGIRRRKSAAHLASTGASAGPAAQQGHQTLTQAAPNSASLAGSRVQT